MFERFTERARQVVVLAQEQARGLRHNYIGTEHILLGLLAEEEGLGAKTLNEAGITIEQATVAVKRIVGSSDEAIDVQIPFTPRGKEVLEMSLREALALGHNYIGTEHILLGLLREGEGVGMRIVMDLGGDAVELREKVIDTLVPTAEARAKLENRLGFDLYQVKAGDTATYPESDSGSFIALAYCGLGCAGEAGEVADQVKKMWRNEGELTPERREKILKECGDTLWYIARMCTELGASMSEVAQDNLDKLADRKKRGVLKSEGDTR